MNTKLPVIALVLLFAVPGLLNAFVLDVPGSFATIQAGIDAAAEGDTVLVAPGTYYENLNLTGKSITLASHYITTGDTMYMHETVIDGNQKGACLFIKSTDTRITPSVIGFTVQNGSGYFEPRDNGSGIRCVDADPLFEWLIVTNCSTYISSSGGGFYFIRSNPVLKKIHVINNKSSMDGGGLSFSSSNPVLEDVNIIGNHATSGAGGIYFSYCDSAKCERVVVRGNRGGGIYCTNSSININRMLMFDNIHNPDDGILCGYSILTISNSTLIGNGFPTIFSHSSEIIIVNTILWSNDKYQISSYNSDDEPQSSLVITNSAINNGISGIITHFIDISEYENNISGDPCFADNIINNYMLRDYSPCIDSGIIKFIWGEKVIVNVLDNDIYGKAPDIGFFEYDSYIGVDKEETINPELILLSPYPNPFNASVTIPYRIRTGSNISLAIYNCMGQKVVQLTDGFHATGMYSAVWNAEGCASGVYYCRLQSGQTILSKKTLYLK